MSIIEKAVSRLGQGKPGIGPKTDTSGATPVERNVDTTRSLVERASLHDSGTTAVPIGEQGVGRAAPNDTRPAVAVPVQAIPAASAVAEASAPGRVIKRVDINLDRLAANNMVTSDGGRNPVAEEFRVIKRPLIDNAFSEDGRPVNRNNLIMVTSALPGEGKTFSAINLAISIAMELDHTVLLVDADVARPSVLRTLGLKSEAGLMDLLLDTSLDMADVLLKTNIDTLTILPAGKNHRHATELLASQTMSGLLDEIASRYPDRIVIFDSPPLLLTSEARVLASQMGQIVVVVEAETTTMHAVKSALSQLEACSNVNLVYNKARDFPGQENYGYYYN